MYHRATDLVSDPWGLSVSPQHFAEHLEVIRQFGNPLHLHELTARLDSRRSIDRAIVVTFDDGYADNLYVAKPLLERYQIPATVFITTGNIDRQQEFWWDELDRILLQPGTLPPALDLVINGQNCSWDLTAGENYSSADARRDRDWRMESLVDPTPRHRLYRSLYQQSQFLPAAERELLLADIRIWANIEPTARATHRCLTPAEIIDLESGGMVEIGAHTLTHPFLSRLPLDFQHQEIQQGKEQLEAILGHPIASFSYPNGSYSPQTRSLVRAAGFKCACSSIKGTVSWPAPDRLLLPRLVVGDWDGDTFTQWLSTALYE